MTSGGGTFSPEEIKYLKSLSAVAEATAKRITYTDDFKRYCVVHYNEGASPVRMFREAGLDPALIGYKRIERCLARWRESQDEILNSGNAKAGVENKLGGGVPVPGDNTPPDHRRQGRKVIPEPATRPRPSGPTKHGNGASDSELFRSGAAGAPNIPESARAARAWRDSAESSLPAGTGSESDFHVSPERRAIIFPVSRKEQNNDLRDLLISQQVRRIDELERQVDMLEALLHGRRRKEQAANTLPEEQTDTAADKSPDADGQ